MAIALHEGYELRHMEAEPFDAMLEKRSPEFFTGSDFRPLSVLTDAERARRDQLRDRLGDPFMLRLGLHRDDELVGWTFGRQWSSMEFMMVNSVVLPDHRRRGLYTAIVPVVLDIARAEGFQVVMSHHHATNSEVLIPKLRAGFVISGFEISDAHGLLVTLKYYFNEIRRQVMEFRVGRIREMPR